MRTQVRITGYLVGPIWWPVGAECFKDLNYDATDQQARTVGEMTLRDHVLRATMDGDFQGCSIAQGELTIRITRSEGARVFTTTRTWPLDHFPSIKDCLHDDPDWWPSYPEADDE